MTASAIRAWAIKGPDGALDAACAEQGQAWGMKEAFTGTSMRTMHEQGYRAVPVEIREHPAQDAALLELLRDCRENLAKLGMDSASAYEHGDRRSQGDAEDEIDAIHKRIDAHLANTEQPK